MSAKILLINPIVVPKNPPRFWTLGMAYMTQTLKQAGYGVELLDIDSHRYTKDFVSDYIAKSPADIIGIGGMASVYSYLSWLIPEIKRIKPSSTIILGGAVASSLGKRCFTRFPIDFSVIGEGEITLPELIKELLGGRNFKDVKGIGFRDRGDVVFTATRTLMTSLEHLPIMDDTLFPMDKLLVNADGIIQIHVQRGCPCNCTFCFNAFRVAGKNVRYRPVEHVIKEMVLLMEKYGEKIKAFTMSGECVTMNKEWLREFTHTIIEQKLNIRYRVTSRVDTIDEERLEWLKKSGCVAVSFGLESGSNAILKIMKKNTTVEKGLWAVHLTKKYISNIEPGIILGYLGETKETLRETVNFCKRLGVKPLLFYPMPFPGTELYKTAIEKGFIKDEEEYLMTMDQNRLGEVFLNMTGMPNDVAMREVFAARREIECFYWQDFVKNVILMIRTQGIKLVAWKALKRLSPKFIKKWLDEKELLHGVIL